MFLCTPTYLIVNTSFSDTEQRSFMTKRAHFIKSVYIDILNSLYVLLFFLFQFTAWVDAVIFVFSLENEASFNAIYNYYTKMSHYRNSAEIPVILVGTQGKCVPYSDYVAKFKLPIKILN